MTQGRPSVRKTSIANLLSDAFEQGRKPFHFVPHARVKIPKPNAFWGNSLTDDLGLQCLVGADLDDRLMQGLEDNIGS